METIGSFRILSLFSCVLHGKSLASDTNTISFGFPYLQVKAVVARGSDNTKYKDASATTIVSYFPQVDVNGFTYLDEEGDGPGELVESEAEEADEEGEGSAAEKTDEEEEFSEEEE